MAKMLIYSPSSLKTSVGVEDGQLIVSLADFGHIPYGQSLVGQVVFPEDNEYGCDPFEDSLTAYNDPNPIVIIRRGECTFVQKVRNVQKGGGKFAVIVDEKDRENVKYITMVNDGTGNGINIPSVMINKIPGEKIIDFYQSQDELVRNQIKFVMNFELSHPDNHVEYDLLLSTYQDKALDFVSGFKSYHEKLGNSVTMTPHYFSWPCLECDEEIKEKDCFGNGKY